MRVFIFFWLKRSRLIKVAQSVGCAKKSFVIFLNLKGAFRRVRTSFKINPQEEEFFFIVQRGSNINHLEEGENV